MPARASDHELLLELRALLSRRPSQGLFRELLELFSSHRKAASEVRQLALDYAAAHLEAWDDGLRNSYRSYDFYGQPPSASCLIRSCDLTHMSTSVASVLKLVQQPAFAQVTLFSLTNALIRTDGLEALADAPHLSNLRVLGLSHNRYSDGFFEALAGSEVLGKLEELHLEGCAIGRPQALLLANGVTIPRLELLDLRRNPLDSAAVEALRRALPEGSRLRWDGEPDQSGL